MARQPPLKLPARPHSYADLPEQAYAPLLIQKLLLAIIDAHPLEGEKRDPESVRQRRLSQALTALLGGQATRGPKHREDLSELLNLARAHLLDTAKHEFEVNHLGAKLGPLGSAGQRIHGLEHIVPSTKPTPVRDKTRVLGHPTVETMTPDERAAYNRLLKKYRDHYEYLWWIATFRDHQEERDMMGTLREIQDALKPWGVGLEIDPLDLGFGSLVKVKA